MNKAILVIDMPERCSDCRFKDSVTNHIDNSIEFTCKAKNELIICDIDKRKDEDCPLKPMPEKKSTDMRLSAMNEWLEHSERIGFNNCIDEILGGKEE